MTLSPIGPAFRNQILRVLPFEEVRRLLPALTRVRLVNGDLLYQAGARIGYVYFVEQGFISMMAMADDADGRVEVGLIGRESVLGSSVLLSPEAASYPQAMVRMPGAAYRIPTAALHASLEHAPELRRLMLQALQASMAQLVQTAACNSRHTLAERLARWLLMAHDRVDGDELPLTQEFLAIMLAVRRPGITIAAGALQAAGLIRQSRGRIVICDRPGLEATACVCYARVRTFVTALAVRNL